MFFCKFPNSASGITLVYEKENCKEEQFYFGIKQKEPSLQIARAHGDSLV
jgi:hypothetical protein